MQDTEAVLESAGGWLAARWRPALQRGATRACGQQTDSDARLQATAPREKPQKQPQQAALPPPPPLWQPHRRWPRSRPAGLGCCQSCRQSCRRRRRGHRGRRLKRRGRLQCCQINPAWDFLLAQIYIAASWHSVSSHASTAKLNLEGVFKTYSKHMAPGFAAPARKASRFVAQCGR